MEDVKPHVMDVIFARWRSQMLYDGVDDCCANFSENVFGSVPEAEVYLLKHILHDYDDEECKEILSTIHESASVGARLFASKDFVPGAEAPHFAKLFGIHMLVATTGRERTAEEYADLPADTDWEYVETHYPENELVGAIEAVPN